MRTLPANCITRGFGEQKAVNNLGSYNSRVIPEVRKPILEVVNLSKRFGTVTAVDSISFKVFEGEIFGLIGLNGAGKTTTILMLSSLLNPDSGSATVNDYDIVKEKDGVRESIGLVFEEEAVDVYLTGKQNLDFAGRMYNLPRQAREKRVAEVLKTVGLEAHADTKVNDYSGGMLRRLEIARGMLTYPKILFLDEPTIGLDVQTRRYLWDYIRRINHERGTTVLLATSYLDEADYLCNRLAIMDKGRIIVTGTPEELKTSIGEYRISLKLSKGSEEDFAAYLQETNWVKNIEKNGLLLLSMKDRSVRILEIVKFARKHGFGVSSIKSSRASLDDVLLHYTKRSVEEQH
jgi:ABC-2 type transport system ATP-binding protein